MQIRDFLQTEGIVIGSSASDKKSVIDTLVELHSRCGNLKNAAAFYEQVLIREEEGTTAVGGATAIPHAQGDAVRRTGLCAGGNRLGCAGRQTGAADLFDCRAEAGWGTFGGVIPPDYHADE